MSSRGAKWARNLLCSSLRSNPSSPLEASGGSGSVVVYCRFGRGHVLRAFFERFAGLDIQTMTGAGSSRRKQAVFVVVFGLEKTQNGKLKAYLQGEAGPMDPKAGTDRLGLALPRFGRRCHHRQRFRERRLAAGTCSTLHKRCSVGVTFWQGGTAALRHCGRPPARQ
jgi:hypothetical protein